MNKHTKHFILFSLAKSVTLPLMFLNSALIGRILGASGFGQWTMIIAASTMLHNVFINWTYASGVRFGCEEWMEDGTLSRTWAARLPLFLTGFLISLILLIFQPFNWLDLLYSVKENLWWLVWVYLMSLWLTNELQTALQGSGQMKLLVLVSPAMTLFFTFFLLLLFLAPRFGYMPEWVVVGQAIITFIVCALIWNMKQKGQVFYWRKPAWEDVKRHLRYGWPLLPTFLVGYITMWGNYSILQAYHSSREVGLFGASYQVMLGIISLNGIFVTISLPRLITKNIESKDATRDFFSNIVPTLFCLWALATIFLIAIVPSVFAIMFGAQFMDSQFMLMVLFTVVPTSILPYLCAVLFNVQQRLGREFIYSVASMLVSLVLSFSLIPSMGGMGAAISTTVSLLITQLIFMWDQHRFMSIPVLRMGILFLTVLLCCIFQYIAGLNLLARLIWSAVSIYFLILLFRKMKIINAGLLSTIFSGNLSRIGLLLNRVLVLKD